MIKQMSSVAKWLVALFIAFILGWLLIADILAHYEVRQHQMAGLFQQEKENLAIPTTSCEQLVVEMKLYAGILQKRRFTEDEQLAIRFMNTERPATQLMLRRLEWLDRCAS